MSEEKLDPPYRIPLSGASTLYFRKFGVSPPGWLWRLDGPEAEKLIEESIRTGEPLEKPHKPTPGFNQPTVLF